MYHENAFRKNLFSRELRVLFVMIQLFYLRLACALRVIRRRPSVLNLFMKQLGHCRWYQVDRLDRLIILPKDRGHLFHPAEVFQGQFLLRLSPLPSLQESS